jgi:flagellin-like hook-associated protein FlgL
MSVVLSASVRQNLLSLQSTADLLATTQSRLSTGKKVNTALDNPTNFFTAQSLDSRAGDIGNLLDGISNGVQVLQQANTGISSLSKLVDTAKSIANQALQTTVGYSTKSNVSATIAGATALDLRGTTSFTSAVASSNVLYNGNAGGVTPLGAGATLGGLSGALVSTAVNGNETAATAIVGTTKLNNIGGGAAGTAGVGTATVADGDTFTVNGKTITFKAGAAPTAATAPTGYGIDASGTSSVATDGNGNSIIYIGASTTASTATVGDVLKAVDLASGVQSATIASGVATLATNAGQSVSTTLAGVTTLHTSTGGDLAISGKADFLKALGLTTALGSGVSTLTATRTTSSLTVGSLIADGSTLNVNGKTISFKNAPTPAPSLTHEGVSGNIETDGNGNSTVYLQSATVADVLKAVDLATGVRTAVVSTTGGAAAVSTANGQTNSSVSISGVLKISTGTTTDLTVTGTGNALAVLGLNGTTGQDTSFEAVRTAGAGGINGKTLTFSSFNGGAAVNVTFGDGTGGTVKTLDQLNAALLVNNQTATLDSVGKLTISSTNDYASSTLGSIASGGVIGGTVTSALAFSTASAPVIDVAAQSVRAGLVSQYNQILTNITNTAADASYNGVNLLAGDQLKLTFNETGKSTLNITGVNYNAAGLGLAALTSGTDFIDNAATNKVIANLTSAGTSLRSQASALGSNLSIVQIRQDFSKNVINVLQTGSSNLTLADTNEEAANSQALSTRQSIAVSALALANTSQQSVLQLLR